MYVYVSGLDGCLGNGKIFSLCYAIETCVMIQLLLVNVSLFELQQRTEDFLINFEFLKDFFLINPNLI